MSDEKDHGVGASRARFALTWEERAAKSQEIEFLRGTLEAAADGILVTDVDGTITHHNENYVRLWRLGSRNLRGVRHVEVLQTISQYFADPAGFLERIRAIYASAQTEEGDELQLSDGTVVERLAKMLLLEGRLVGRVWSFRDVTTQVRLQESLRQQTCTLEVLNRTATVLASEVNIHTVVQAVTDAATELTGAQFGVFFYNIVNEQGEAFTLYTLSGVDRDKFKDLPLPRATALFGPTFRGGHVIRSDDVLAHSEFGKSVPFHGMPGSHLPVRSYLAAPVASRSGDVHGGLFFGHEAPAVFTAEHEKLVSALAAQAAVAIDNARFLEANVRGQRQLKELNETLEQRVLERTKQLQRSEQQFEQLVAGVSDAAIFMLDPRGVVVSWNLGAERIKKYTSQEIVGKHFSLFYTAEDRATGVPEQALLVAERTGKYDSEGWRVRKDGTRFWASVLIDALRAPDGSLLGFAKVTRDMTERRAILEQLHQSQKMEAIGQLTGGVAHDFNNLLTVILGNLDTLWHQVPTTETRWRRAVDQAMRSAQRAATLTQQLLAFARRQPLNPKPTDVNRLVSNMSDLIRRTLSEEISLETVLAAGAWPVEIDPHQLESALLNLAVNARDAMPEGGKLTIETANAHLDERYSASFAEISPGQYLMICLSDTGTGMTQEVMSRAFDPFFTTKPVGKGTGLGLSQVFGFVKQSGGHVRLYSEVGQGTTVKIYLPRLLRKAGTAEEEKDGVEPLAYGDESILVVEDEEDVRIYSTESLRELGFSVLEAADGQAALRTLQHHPEIKLLFTDVGLPGINGRELVEQARRLRPDLKVLFTTGYARNAIVHQGRLDEGVDLLTKPFTRAQLATRVRDVLDSVQPVAAAQPVALVVEDEPLVRMFLLETLTDMGFSVLQAASAREGFTLAERTRTLDLAVIDVGLPDRSGLQLAADLRAALPNLAITIASGYGQEARGSLRDDPRVTFLAKPFQAQALRDAVQRMSSASVERDT